MFHSIRGSFRTRSIKPCVQITVEHAVFVWETTMRRTAKEAVCILLGLALLYVVIPLLIPLQGEAKHDSSTYSTYTRYNIDYDSTYRGGAVKVNMGQQAMTGSNNSDGNGTQAHNRQPHVHSRTPVREIASITHTYTGKSPDDVRAENNQKTRDLVSDEGESEGRPLGLISPGTPSPKVILMWNSFFGAVGIGARRPFDNCPVECTLSMEQNDLPKADAVIVHAFYRRDTLASATLPARAHDKQVFVWLLMENPVRSVPGLRDLNYNDVFNLTMTYLDNDQTDLYTPYGDVVRRGLPDAARVPTLKHLKKKAKQVVWLVSNCQANSSRYEYADELSKHINVDVFGKCGEDVCPKWADCMGTLADDYKFYLAMENGLCEGYVTEKVFGALQTSMVPVIYGGANYSQVLPPSSYIDVRDFQSPRALAMRLKIISRNPIELRNYLRWKENYEIRNAQWHKSENLCKLCRILHDDSYRFKTGFDPLDYWKEEHCLFGERERKAVHLI